MRGEGLSVTQAVEFAEERQPARCVSVGEASRPENRRSGVLHSRPNISAIIRADSKSVLAC
jgi:hypothetical protein